MANKLLFAHKLNMPHIPTRWHEIDPVNEVFLPEIWANNAPALSEAGGTNMIYSYLKNGADKELAADGTDPVLNYDYLATQDSYISRLNFEILDGGIRNDRFAGLASALTNGLLLSVLDTDLTETLDFLDGTPIKVSADFSILAGVDAIAIASAGEDLLPIRFTIMRSGTALFLEKQQRIRLVVQDNLSTITRFRAMVQGYKIP